MLLYMETKRKKEKNVAEKHIALRKIKLFLFAQCHLKYQN